MSNSIDFNKLKELQFEFKMAEKQARKFKRENNGIASAEECNQYAIAADVAAQIANIYKGRVPAEEAAWAAQFSKYDQMAIEMDELLNGHKRKAVKQTAPAASGSSSAAPAEEKKEDAENEFSRFADEDISAETIAGWFKLEKKLGRNDDDFVFASVAGMDDLKERLIRCVRSSGMSKVSKRLKRSKVRSYFFYGLPGCGKTFIVNCFAHELMKQGYRVMYLTGGQIHSQWQGISEKNVEKAFEVAKALAPCIIFIDEIESVCRTRGESYQSSHVEATTTAFLNAYNDLKDSDEKVIFIGATNHPELVDTAMMDRVVPIQVDLPDQAALANKFRMELEDVIQLADDITYETMAEECAGYSYRDVEHLLEVLKDNIEEAVVNAYDDDDDAADAAMESGEFPLTNRMFFEAFDDPASAPSNKIEIMASLEKWATGFANGFME